MTGMQSAYDGRGMPPRPRRPSTPYSPLESQCSRNIGQPLPGSMCECSAPLADSRFG